MRRGPKPLTAAEQRMHDVVRDRAHGNCEICGRLGTDWSHRRSRAQGGRWRPSNGLWLCRVDHLDLEANPSFADTGGWRFVHRDPDPLTTPAWIRPPLLWTAWWCLDDEGLYVLAEDQPPAPNLLPPRSNR